MSDQIISMEILCFLLGFSCLHLASMFGHTAIVAYLIAKGQDVDLPDKNGRTPLMLAALHAKRYERKFVWKKKKNNNNNIILFLAVIQHNY